VYVNLYGLTTSICRVDGRSVTCTTVWNMLVTVDVNPEWVNHCFPPHLQELRCGWFYLSCVFHILVWMCFLWCSLVLEVDVNLYGLTTSMCRSHHKRNNNYMINAIIFFEESKPLISASPSLMLLHHRFPLGFRFITFLWFCIQSMTGSMFMWWNMALITGSVDAITCTFA
jgi:hypothetical protein